MGTIDQDFTVDLNGDIRSSGPDYFRVIELHRFLQDLADDQQMSGNDLIDITSQNPSTRSTDNIITLNGNYNIDDATAKWLYDGSVTQDGGDTVYAGLEVVGNVPGTTELQIFQDDSEIPEWWGTGINTGGGAFIMRTMIKIRGGLHDGTEQIGALIDGGRIRVQAREFNDTYAEFEVTLGLGNSTAAIFTGDDIFNNTAQATVAAWDCSNTEGYQTIDLQNGNGAQEQPSSMKWVSQSHR
jgi:hypothetical protein